MFRYISQHRRWVNWFEYFFLKDFSPFAFSRGHVTLWSFQWQHFVVHPNKHEQWRRQNGSKATQTTTTGNRWNSRYSIKGLFELTWFGGRNSWLFSFMYMLSPSNCREKEGNEKTGRRQTHNNKDRKQRFFSQSGEIQKPHSSLMTASPRLIDLNALVDVSNYGSLETRIIRPCQRLCNSHSSPQLAYSLRLPG